MTRCGKAHPEPRIARITDMHSAPPWHLWLAAAVVALALVPVQPSGR